MGIPIALPDPLAKGDSDNASRIRARAGFSPFTWCPTLLTPASHTASGSLRFATTQRALRALHKGSRRG